jgi:SAM-dependent methyltransferase
MMVGLNRRPFVVSRLSHQNSEPGSVAAYLGRDTEELADYALNLSGRDVLDLGCGAGIVGIVTALSDPARRVTGVDLCAEAVQVARFNAALNDAPYEAMEGDLYAPVADRRFDLVLADPPSIPFPDDLASPIYGSGGPEGWRLLARILTGAERALRPGGRAVAITELQCPPGRIPFCEWLQDWVRGAPGRIARLHVVVSRLLPPDYYRSLGEKLGFLPGTEPRTGGGSDLGARLEAFGREADLRFGHWVHLEFTTSRDMPSSLSVVWDSPRPNPASQPRIRVPRMEFEFLMGCHYGQPLDAFGTLFTRFMDEADGSRTLEDISNRVSRGSLPYLIDLSRVLSDMGLVEYDNLPSAGKPS